MVDESAPYGRALRELRERRGENQVEVALALGITPGHLSHLENEKRLPSLDLVFRISDYFGLSPDEQAALSASVERARAKGAGERIAARGVRVRGAIRTRGTVPRAASDKREQTHDEDPRLRAVVEDLRAAWTDPEARDALAATIKAFADRVRGR